MKVQECDASKASYQFSSPAHRHLKNDPFVETKGLHNCYYMRKNKKMMTCYFMLFSKTPFNK